jgi:long-chain acyl-CoA synthetase
MNEQPKNLNQAFLAAMDAYAKQTCFHIKRGGQYYHRVSYREFQTLAFRIARFYNSQGVTNGERVAIAATHSVEWMAAYVGCLLAGGTVVPLHLSLAPVTLHFILQDVGACLAVLQDQEHLQKISASLATDDGDRLSDLKTILAIDNGTEPLPGVIPMEAVLAEPTLTPEEEAAIRSHADSVAPQAVASIHYVASETGQPRGAVFEHAQSLAAMQHIAEWFTFDDDELAFTIRPWSEATNLLVSHHYFLSGIANVLSENPETVPEDLQQTSPTVMLSVPYGSELFYKAYMSQLAEQSEASQEVFQWALAKGKEYQAAGSAASPELRQEYARADMTFFSQIRGELGGRMRRAYSTGAPLSREIVEFFEVVGVSILDIYSMTEAGGFPAVNRPDACRPGSCGQVAPGFQIRIAEDGEVLVKGETVMREYWQRPEETQQAFDDEGWLRSGDIGHVDEDGYLYITEHKRHLMVMSTGRKIAATAIENALTASPFITQAAVVGEGKSYVSAMIVPDLKVLAAHFQKIKDEEGRPVATTTHPQVEALLDEVIGEINSQLDRWEQIREYSLLDQPLSRDTGELTASMKISRHTVARRYARQIKAMYPETLQLEAKEVSQVQVEPERLRELLEKEKILDAWMTDAGIEFLFELARDKQIDAPSMVNICDTVAMIAQMESEEIPLSTALIVGDPVRIGHILPVSQVQLLHSDHIRRMRRILVTMAKVVDGLVLGYLVDKYGYVRGVHKLEVALDEPGSYLLGPQFRHHAAISQQCDAVVFFVPIGGRQVRVFANGQLVGRYANGDWSPDNMLRVDEAVAQLAQEKNYDLDLVRRVLRCAFQMSEKNLGAIFIVGNADDILEHSDASEISHFAAIVSAEMEQLSDQELINFAKQDGATVIDVQGQFRGCMVLLRPDADTQAEIGPGKGARHSSAAKMSAEAQCLAITVSHDGPITIYDSGRRVLSL